MSLYQRTIGSFNIIERFYAITPIHFKLILFKCGNFKKLRCPNYSLQFLILAVAPYLYRGKTEQ